MTVVKFKQQFRFEFVSLISMLPSDYACCMLHIHVPHLALINEVMVDLIFTWGVTLQVRGNSSQEIVQPINLTGLNIGPVAPAPWTGPRLPLLPAIPNVYTLLAAKYILAALGEDDRWCHWGRLTNATLECIIQQTSQTKGNRHAAGQSKHF